jgi:hypothetical protein
MNQRNREKYKNQLFRETGTSNRLFEGNTDGGQERSKVKKIYQRLKRRVIRLFGIVKVQRPKKFASAEAAVVEDQWKRRRMLLASFLFTVIFGASRFFLEKYFGSLGSLLLFALGASALMALILIWVFKRDLTLKSYRLISIFVGTSVFGIVLFIELFLLGYINVIFEAISLLLLLIFLMIYLYVILLTANIFNVAKFRKVPLLQVAQTAGYIVTILNIYFLTYGFLSLELPVYMYILMFLSFTVVVFPVINSFDLGLYRETIYSAGVGWIGFLSLFAVSFWPTTFRLAAMLPTMVILISLGVVMNLLRRKLKLTLVLEYLLLFLVVIFILFNSLSY